MAGRHDARRTRFFNSRTGGHDFVVVSQNDGDDEVLVAPRLRLRPAATWGDVEGRLRDLGATHTPDDGLITLGDPASEIRHDGTVLAQVVDELADRVMPEYVLIAQQRVQPAEDPEHPKQRVGATDRPASSRLGLGAGTKVAVVDTGVADQPGARDVWTQGSWTPNGQVFDALYDVRPARAKYLAWAAGHGTFVGSLIRQVAPGAEIVPIRACSHMGFETAGEVAAGIRRAVALGADVINLSWGMYALPSARDDEGRPTDYHEMTELRAAVELARDNGAVVVAAAGNSESPDLMFPAAWPEVVAVAALDADGRRWHGSNYGSWVDASALGVRLHGVYVRGKEHPLNDPDGRPETWDDPNLNYAEWSGTSFAAPLVAAEIAIAKAALGPTSTAQDAWDAVRSTSSPAVDEGCGKQIVVDLPGQT